MLGTGVFVLFTTIVAAPAQAQTTAPGTRLPVDHKQTISANPFALMFEYFNAEYERKHTGSSTWGLSGSSFGFNEADYRNAQVFYRYYPQNAALGGFYIGGRGGAHRVSVSRESGTFFGVSVALGYNWLLWNRAELQRRHRRERDASVRRIARRRVADGPWHPARERRLELLAGAECKRRNAERTSIPELTCDGVARRW